MHVLEKFAMSKVRALVSRVHVAVVWRGVRGRREVTQWACTSVAQRTVQSGDL